MFNFKVPPKQKYFQKFLTEFCETSSHASLTEKTTSLKLKLFKFVVATFTTSTCRRQVNVFKINQ